MASSFVPLKKIRQIIIKLKNDNNIKNFTFNMCIRDNNKARDIFQLKSQWDAAILWEIRRRIYDAVLTPASRPLTG